MVKNRYGTLIQASPEHANFCPKTLIVFVHGILATARTTWSEDLPEWVMKEARIRADVFLYDYPAMPWQSGSIETAARDLATSLATNLDRYDHFFFITHSNGGLVVKQMLLDDFRLTEAKLGSSNNLSLDYDDLDSIVLRTRKIVHIAVPHRGGSLLLTLLLSPLVIPLMITSLFFLIPRVLTFGSLKWGYQAIYWQLRYHRRALACLDDELIDFAKRFAERGFERPVSVDIAADTDLAVPELSGRSKRGVKVIGTEEVLRVLAERWELRGSHMSVKVPRDPSDPVVKVIANEVGKFSPPWAWTVANATTGRVFRLNRQLDVTMLVSGQPPEILPTLHAQIGGTLEVPRKVQADSLGMIHDLIALGGSRPKCVVLTGEAGVGKSTVLRTLARDLARDFMRGDRCLPISIPLQDIKFSRETIQSIKNAGPFVQGKRLFDALLDDWCRWLETLTFYNAVRSEQIREFIKNSRCTVILDSVDEFLLNNPGLELLQFRRLGDWIKQEYRENGNLIIIYGVRKTQIGWEMLTPSNDLALEIPLLTTEQAVELEPKAKDLPDLNDERLKSMLLKPLYRLLWAELANRNRVSSLNHAQLLELLVISLIKKSGLLDMPNLAGEPTDERLWLDSLTIMGWLFFRKFRRDGRVGVSILQKEAEELCKEWKAHYDKVQSETAQEVANEMMAAFKLLEDESLFDILLSRTIFLPTGTKRNPSIRVMHHEHLDFLAARYLTRCVLSLNLRELRARGYTTELFRVASDLLHDHHIQHDLIKATFDYAGELREQYPIDAALVAGNIVGLLANLQSVITGPALDTLLSRMHEMPPVALHILITGLAFRAIRRENDPSADQIRAKLIPILQDLSKRETANGVNALTSSACWCYLKAFASALGMDCLPTSPWPAPNDAARDQILSLVWRHTADGSLEPGMRSLQVAFLEVQQQVLEIEHRAISAVHYLYVISLAYSESRQCEEVTQCLQAILADGSVIGSRYHAYGAVPEVRQLYAACQKLVGSVTGGRQPT